MEGSRLLDSEADSVVLVLVVASDRDGLGLDLGVETNERACVTFDGARVGGDLGGVLDDAQVEGALCAEASSVCCDTK